MNEKDKMLWRQAKKRVSFRKHLFTYIIVNGFVWALFLFRRLGSDMDMDNGNAFGHMHHFFIPWPIFMTLGWGVGLAFNFYSAYYGSKYDAVEKEYEKLKNSGK